MSQSVKTLPPDPADRDDLGARLRRRRKVRGLSLKEVASRAEVSIGLVSQVERGLTMPSVRSLGAICGALEMPVGWLFDRADAEGESDLVVRQHQRRVLDLGAKGMVKELMTPDSCTGIQMMRLVIRPGGSTGDTPYNHPTGAKCGTVLSGQLVMEVDGDTHHLNAGDSFAFEASRMIRFWCGGSETAEVLWIVTPAVY
ncbi:cupin domain-containing protein [Paracoccus sp. Z118]|uniref:cupin domain-containing protein n=1 Tax=Paracoccus sp. Z118 TaxID=2851017 RepID=UPI001C2CA039|nr:cupin domain-containing protein [Paracoccus sp. Z118]MBV0892568.1 cupin domain-containing protein [Paracoccus sp. Z118]